MHKGRWSTNILNGYKHIWHFLHIKNVVGLFSIWVQRLATRWRQIYSCMLSMVLKAALQWLEEESDVFKVQIHTKYIVNCGDMAKSSMHNALAFNIYWNLLQYANSMQLLCHSVMFTTHIYICWSMITSIQYAVCNIFECSLQYGIPLCFGLNHVTVPLLTTAATALSSVAL